MSELDILSYNIDNWRKINRHKQDKIKLHNIIVATCAHAIVWNCTYQKINCVLKMVVLSKTKSFKKNFKDNDKNYPIYKLFECRAPVVHSRFLAEVNKLKDLSSRGLAPKVYDCWVDDVSFTVDYGFILMKKMDSDLTHILYERDLTSKENDLINKLINNLHEKYGIAHRDLKPANMGVNLNKKKEIIECLVFDCSTVGYKKQYSSARFKKLCKKDWLKYYERKAEDLETGRLMKKKNK